MPYPDTQSPDASPFESPVSRASIYDPPPSSPLYDNPVPPFKPSSVTKRGNKMEYLASGGALGKDKKKAVQPSMAQKIYSQGKGQLQAYNALLPGTLDLESRSAAGFGNIYRREAAKAAAHDLNMFQALGSQYVQSIKNADPNQARILARLNGTDPMGERDLEQSVRAAQAARGAGYGNSDMMSELVNMDRQRQERLLRVGMFNQSVVGDPFLAVTGRASQTRPQGSNPMSPGYGQVGPDSLSLYVNNEIQDQQKAAANAANRSALYGAAISAVGSIAGGAASKI